MQGTITVKGTNRNGYPFGIIESDGTTYYFDQRGLVGTNINDLHINDFVEFNPYDNGVNNIALNIHAINQKQEDVELSESESSSTTVIAPNFYKTNSQIFEKDNSAIHEIIPSDLKATIIQLIKNKCDSDDGILLAEFSTILKYEGIDYKNYGFQKFRDFCISLGNPVSVIDREIGNGIHPFVYLEGLQITPKQNTGIYEYIAPIINAASTQEQAIAKAFAKVFYITVFDHIDASLNSRYTYYLLKPTHFFSEKFNLNREIIMIFSNYDTFEPRSLDAIDLVHRKIAQKSPLRLERICSVMVSGDPNVSEQLKDLLKTNSAEMQMIVPFSYQEIYKNYNNPDWENFVHKRFVEYFYERDLFSFSDPIKKDLYFFGRQSFVQSLVGCYKSYQNVGVFGLRRSGKTSILYAMQRALKRMNHKWLQIDCGTIATMRWFEALQYIVKQAYDIFGIESTRNINEKYIDSTASKLFEEDMLELSKHTDGTLMIMFDEIEQITFDIALDNCWREGSDFIRFWRVFRAYYQKYPANISFIIAGTNPKAVETSLVSGYDNPLYQQLKIMYLPPFDVKETTEMVNKLGGFMGLKFDEMVCSFLTQDYGGQPYIIRKICSAINAYLNQQKITKPKKITINIYNEVNSQFKESSELEEYCTLIIDILRRNYEKEYNLLKHLALYNKFPSDRDSKLALEHLIGYGIIRLDENIPGFTNETLKKYLINEHPYERKLRTNEEKWAEINERRNKVEVKLREKVRLLLMVGLGEGLAKDKIIETLTHLGIMKDAYKNYSYSDFFDQQKCEIYWSEMINLVFFNWSCFKNVFTDQKLFRANGEIVNTLRRGDCHAQEVTDEEFENFRGAISWLETEINK